MTVATQHAHVLNYVVEVVAVNVVHLQRDRLSAPLCALALEADVPLRAQQVVAQLLPLTSCGHIRRVVLRMPDEVRNVEPETTEVLGHSPVVAALCIYVELAADVRDRICKFDTRTKLVLHLW